MAAADRISMYLAASVNLRTGIFFPACGFILTNRAKRIRMADK